MFIEPNSHHRHQNHQHHPSADPAPLPYLSASPAGRSASSVSSASSTGSASSGAGPDPKSGALLSLAASPMERNAADYTQTGLPSPYPSSFGDTQSEGSIDHPSSAAAAAAAAASSQYPVKQEVTYSNQVTPTSEYGVYPSSARSGSFQDHGHQRSSYHHPSGSHTSASSRSTSSAGAGMAQQQHPGATSPLSPVQQQLLPQSQQHQQQAHQQSQQQQHQHQQGPQPVQQGPQTAHQPHHQPPSLPLPRPHHQPHDDGQSHGHYPPVGGRSRSDSQLSLDPSIAAPSPTYPYPHSPYGQGHVGHYSQDSSASLYRGPDWGSYGQATPLTPHHHHNVFPPSPAAAPRAHGQVYSFVPIPGAQQHKRPRRRYEEIERMYKCGWQGCEKAYGTLNHLNAHVTMQSHGPKRTPEEFKEIRKEWRARKKAQEEELRAREQQQRQAEAASTSAVGGAQNGEDGSVGPDDNGPVAPYTAVARPVLPPIGYSTSQYPSTPSSALPQQPLDYSTASPMYSTYPPQPSGYAPYPPANGTQPPTQ